VHAPKKHRGVIFRENDCGEHIDHGELGRNLKLAKSMNSRRLVSKTLTHSKSDNGNLEMGMRAVSTCSKIQIDKE